MFMRQSILRVGSAALLALGIALPGLSAANAESVMKICGDQWKAAKAAGTTNGETWPQYLSQCRAQQNNAGMGGGMAPTSAAPAPTTAQAPMAGKTTSQCNAEYAANKAAIRAAGQTKREFVAACRSGNETIPQGSAAAPAPTPAPASAPAPSGGSLFPWQQTASRSCARAGPGQLQRACAPSQKRIGATGTVPLPWRDRGLGQRALAHLPLSRHARLREHEARRVHVRGRRDRGRQQGRKE